MYLLMYERLAELTEEIQAIQKFIDKLKKENQKMREALENIVELQGDAHDNDLTMGCKIFGGDGCFACMTQDIALKALKEEE